MYIVGKRKKETQRAGSDSIGGLAGAYIDASNDEQPRGRAAERKWNQ